jgi:ribosomal protein L32
MKAQVLVTSDGSDSDDDDDVNDEVCDDTSLKTKCKQVRKCSNCGQPGHTKRVCPKQPRQEKNLQEEENLLEEDRDENSSSSDEESDKKTSANDRLYHE